MKDKTTHGFIILNEHDLSIVVQVKEEDNDWKLKTEPRIFASEEDADEFASSRLDMFSVVEIHFRHRWIHHEVNQKSEGGSND